LHADILEAKISLKVLRFAGTISSELKPISWKAEMMLQKPSNLMVPLTNVWQSFIPKLS